MSNTLEVEQSRDGVAQTAPDVGSEKPAVKKMVNLGTVRLHHEGEVILVPVPSDDPNDPLNWTQPFKYYATFIICLAMFTCNFLAAGPTIAIVQTAEEFNPDWKETGGLIPAISKTAYFFTSTALLQGTGNLIWMPLVNRYGRRPIYLLSYTLYLACAIWLACTYSYGSFLAARILMGFASGAAETMAPLSIADIFFLHERGVVMATYSAALVSGVSGGIIIAGLITINLNWRYIYYVAIALIGLTLILAFFTFPETAYQRPASAECSQPSPSRLSEDEKADPTATTHIENGSGGIPAKKTYYQRLAIFSGTHTQESFWKLFIRPFALILLPPVLWCSLVQSVTIGFIVAVTSNVASAYSTAYEFQSYQTGLCFIAAIIGALLGIYFGGSIGDMTADYFTRRNGGLREPEMRLPAIMISVITTPLSLLLYGAGIQYSLHWMCPTVGLALLNFSVVQATNVALVYTIDAYRPIAGEVTLTTMAFKSAFGFLLSFYTNPWIQKSGYLNAYGEMAAISVAVLLFWIVFYVWGKRIRHATWHWKSTAWVHWAEDREVGE